MPWREWLRELVAAGTIVFATGTGSFMANPDTFPVGLHIVFFNVGQADAIAIVAPDGDAAVIDAGLGASSAAQIAAFLRDGQENGVGEIMDVKFGIVTHYDQDHMGGSRASPTKASASGPSTIRGLLSNATAPRGIPNTSNSRATPTTTARRTRARTISSGTA